MKRRKTLTDFIGLLFFSKQNPAVKNDEIHENGKNVMMVEVKHPPKIHVNPIQGNTPKDIADEYGKVELKFERVRVRAKLNEPNF